MSTPDQTIAFDPEAYKTKPSEGPFRSKAALLQECRLMDPSQPHWEQYQKWAQDHGVANGSIIMSVNSPGYLRIRRDTLKAQLKSFKDTSPESKAGGGFALPEALTNAFNAAASKHEGGPFNVMLMNSLRYISYFDLRASFPNLDIHATCAAPTENHAEQCNNLIQTIAPELADHLKFSSTWSQDNFHLANIDFAAIYFDQASLYKLAADIEKTNATSVVFSNVARNTVSFNGDEEWMGQRTFGGITPYRIPALGEVKDAMMRQGYTLEKTSVDPIAYTGDPNSPYVRNPDERDNFSFIWPAPLN
jgi:hypothetical protein